MDEGQKDAGPVVLVIGGGSPAGTLALIRSLEHRGVVVLDATPRSRVERITPAALELAQTCHVEPVRWRAETAGELRREMLARERRGGGKVRNTRRG